MMDQRKRRRLLMKERDTGPKGGDRQPAHEGGREGTGTRPSGTGTRGGKSGDKSGGKSGGKRDGK